MALTEHVDGEIQVVGAAVRARADCFGRDLPAASDALPCQMGGSAPAVPRNRPHERDAGDPAAVRTSEDRRTVAVQLEPEAAFVKQAMMASAELNQVAE
jgi:hypothetical protein